MLIRSFGLRAKLGLTLASLTLLPLATAPARAQGKPSGGPTLSAAQQKKAQSLATQYQKAMQSLGNDKSLSQTQKQAKFQSLAKSYQSEMMALLTPAQRERVTQGQKKQQAFAKAHQSQITEAQALGKEITTSLTADQKTKMSALKQASQGQATAIQNDKSLSAQAKQQKLIALQRDSQAKFLNLLTPTQRSKFAHIQQIQAQVVKDAQAAR